MIPKRIAGTLTTSVADGAASITRQTGAKVEEFQAIKPLYVAMSLNPEDVRNWTFPNCFTGAFIFPRSQEKVKWYWAVIGASGGYVPLAFELYVPPGTPLLYEPDFQVDVNLTGTGQVAIMEYVLYYDIVDTDEMTMVQEMSRYINL